MSYKDQHTPHNDKDYTPCACLECAFATCGASVKKTEQWLKIASQTYWRWWATAGAPDR